MTANKLHALASKAILYGAATSLLLTLAQLTLAQETRTWVDSSGTFKIDATYQRLENKNVLLKLPSGETKQIPLALLSSADQDYVKDLLSPAPAVAETPGAAESLSSKMADPKQSLGPRIWSDSSGAFKIDATYQKSVNGNVLLKLSSGELKQIPLAMLSSADQNYVNGLLAPADATPAPAGSLGKVAELNESSVPEQRTWIDSSGAFKIEATYQKLENGNVLLKLASGEFKQIPLNVLSGGDQDYVKALLAPTARVETPVVKTTVAPVVPSSPVVPSTPVTRSTPAAPSIPDAADEVVSLPPVTPKQTNLPTTAVGETPSQVGLLSTKPTEPAAAEVEVTEDFAAADVEMPAPIVHIGQRIGDLNLLEIKIPPTIDGIRTNPKYLFPVERNDLAILPREFQAPALRLLEEPNKPREAVLALEYLKVHWPKDRQPTLVKLVINCASSDDKVNRELALQILTDRESDQCFPYIFARVDDTSFSIRSIAYQLLRKVGDRRAIEPLAKRFASGDVDRIASLLRSFGSDCESAMIKYLTHEDPDIRLRACNLIGKVGTARSLPVLEQMIDREETLILKAQTRSAIKKIKKRSQGVVQ